MTGRRIAEIVPWLGLALFLMMAIMGEQGLLRLWHIQQDRSDIVSELARADRHNTLLKSQVHAMRHNPRFIEKVVREELSLVRKNEILYRFDE